MSEYKYSTRRKGGKRRFYKRKTFWFVGFMLCGIAGMIALLYLDQFTREYRERALTYDLEKIDKLEIPSIILDRNEEEIGRVFVQNRSVMSVSDVPELFVDSLRAGEDSRFLSHNGVDVIGIIRAVKLNFQAGTTTQGASTITQQLARNAYPLKQDALARGETSIQRKMVEAFLAMRIEKRYSKEEILEFYLNRIYFGSGFYGLRSASLGYFGKEPKHLNLVECATIVGLIKNPTNNSPLNDIEASKKARDMVLLRMEKEGMISGKELREAKEKPIKLNPKPIRRETSHLYERIADSVAKNLGEDALANGGYKIHTTILKAAQDAAEKSLAETLQRAEQNPGYVHQKHSEYRKGVTEGNPEYVQGAVFMVDHLTGEVIAHVGGRDYAESPFDFIEQGKRPLGTAFFPFLYATALAGEHTPASMVLDQPMDNRSVMVGGREGILGEWGMEVSSPVYEGEITLRNAFQKAKIAATVRLGSEVGIQRILDAGVSFGFSWEDAEPLPRVSVGWESASLKQAVTAISTFPLGGKKGPNQFTYIAKIENSAGKEVFRKKAVQNPSGRLLAEPVAWQLHDMMVGGMEEGSARGLKQQLRGAPFHGAGKGGTTPEFSDTWFLGYNERISCGVWAGFLQGNSEPIYPGAFSRDLTMPVWVATMNAVVPSFSGGEIERPNELVPVQICSVSGQRATQFCQQLVKDADTGKVATMSTEMTEYLRQANQSLPYCSVHSGSLSGGMTATEAFNSLSGSNALPVRPTAPVLLGDDPFHTEVPSFAAKDDGERFNYQITNVLDSFDLGKIEQPIRLPKPPRLDINPD